MTTEATYTAEAVATLDEAREEAERHFAAFFGARKWRIVHESAYPVIENHKGKVVASRVEFTAEVAE